MLLPPIVPDQTRARKRSLSGAGWLGSVTSAISLLSALKRLDVSASRDRCGRVRTGFLTPMIWSPQYQPARQVPQSAPARHLSPALQCDQERSPPSNALHLPRPSRMESNPGCAPAGQRGQKSKTHTSQFLRRCGPDRPPFCLPVERWTQLERQSRSERRPPQKLETPRQMPRQQTNHLFSCVVPLPND